MQKRKKIIIIGVVTLILFWGGKNILERTLGRSGDDGQRKFLAKNFRGESENVLPKPLILEIDGIKYEDEITTEISVYDFMSKLRNEGKIDFTEKNYTGMGKFIISINGLKGNGSENWIYYVNGKKANVGVSNYKINKGDTVSWKYEKSNY